MAWKAQHKGIGWRVGYYGVQSCLLFGLLEYFKEQLNVEAMDD